MTPGRESRALRLKRLKQTGGGERSGQAKVAPSPQSALVLDALQDHRKPVSLAALVKELGVDRLYLWRKLNLLVKYGLVKRVKRGTYEAVKV